MYKATYKCRRCGETFASAEFNEQWCFETISSKIIKCHKFYFHTVPESGIHNCPDGSIGYADFVGFKREE